MCCQKGVSLITQALADFHMCSLTYGIQQALSGNGKRYPFVCAKSCNIPRLKTYKHTLTSTEVQGPVHSFNLITLEYL